MPPIVKGNQLTALLEQVGSPVVKKLGNGREIQETYRCKYELVEQLIPDIGDAHSTFSNSRVSDVTYVRDTALAIITVTYRPFGSTVIKENGSVIQTADSNAMDIPIERHPSYSASWATSKAGVESYLEPQPVYVRTSYTGTFGFSESTLIADVGKRNSPTGLTGATADKWLKTGISVRQIGDQYEITETWQYAANGWDTDIYASS